MPKGLFQRLLPHLIAVIIFLVIAVIYCRPALQGMVLNQHDITQWKGAIHQSEVIREQTGKQPLWTNSMFSGMPAFQIGTPANNVVPWIVHSILSLGLPGPIQFFFLACICFYFLAMVLRLNPVVGIFGALSFAYATYNPVIITVGHDTKMWSIAYMPALLGSILLIFQRKYWLGAGLTALFASVLISMNHPQIDYYLFITIGVMTVFFIAKWIREKEISHLVKALGLAVVAGAIGVLVNAVTILSTYEYQKETIRGGYSELTTQKQGDAAGGLSKDYAFSYSMGKAEPLTMLLPRSFGGHTPGGNNPGLKAPMDETDSKTAEFLSNNQQSPENINYYWGNLGVTSGPPYVGALVCLLAFLGLFIVKSIHRWWILTAVVLAILMSWGSNFDSFNSFLYHSLPMYNKFRAPSMILVIPQLVLPLLAMLALNQLATTDQQQLWPDLKKGLIGLGVLFIVLFAMYASLDFTNSEERKMMSEMTAQNPQQAEGYRAYFNALKEDRQSLFMGDLLRVFGFLVAAGVLVWLALKRTIKPAFLFGGIALLSFIDLISIDLKYLNADSFIEKGTNDAVFTLTDKDQAILADKGYYRVFNVSGNAFAEAVTSYHYNSIGGYHAVKLRIYQDLIENQLSKGNMQVLNMLNTKYFIQKDEAGNTQNYQRNDSALGAAWLVKNVVLVKDAQAEMKALDQFTPAIRPLCGRHLPTA